MKMPMTNTQIIRAVKIIARAMGRTAGERVKAADGDWYPRKGTLMMYLTHNRDYSLVISHGGPRPSGATVFRGTKAEIVKTADLVRLLDVHSAPKRMTKLKRSRIRVW